MRTKALITGQLPAILLAATLLTGCGGGDGATEKPKATDTPAEPTPMLEGAAKDYYETVLRGYDATFVVTYRTKTSDGSDGGRIVIYNQPPLSRLDTIAPGESEPSSVLISKGPDLAAISCTRDGQWSCSEIEPLGDSLLRTGGPVVFLEPNELLPYSVIEERSLTFAGQRARCFELFSEREEEENDYCFSQEGVPLWSSPIFGTVAAIEYSRDVPNDAFRPLED